MKTVDILLFMLVNVIMGSAFAASGYAMKYFTPIFTYALRFLMVGLGFCWFYKFDKRELKKMLILGSLQAFNFTGMSLGVKHLSSSTTAIILRLDIVFSVIFASFLLKEKIKPNTIISIIMCFLGIFIINKNIQFGNLGYLFLLILSAMAGGLTNVKIKEIKNMDNIAITVYLFLIVGIELLFISIFFENWHHLTMPDMKGWISILYLSLIVTYLSYYLYYTLLRRNTVSKTMPLQFLRIIFAIIFGRLLLGEPITAVKIIGTLIIMTGITIGQLDFGKKKK